MSKHGMQPGLKAAHLVRGEHAENACKKFLRRHGLKHLCSNYRCRYGEIDLVMMEGSCLVFVEVRYRASAGFGDGLESVTAAKQTKLRRSAEHYLQVHGNCEARFDVVSMSKNNQTKSLFSAGDGYQYDWIRNAF